MKAVRIVGTPLASDGAAASLPYHVDIAVGTDIVQLFGHLDYGGQPFAATVAVMPDDASATLATPDVRLSLIVGDV
jgi:hypothetical protein